METMDKIHKGVLRKFHTLCSYLGLTEAEKHAIVESFGVESSADIDTHDLIDVCASLSRQLEGGRGDEMDKMRKRAMAAIGGYLRATGRESNATVIKGIACRVTGHTDFNRIPRERLRNLVGLFNNKVKDARAVSGITDTLLLQTLREYGNGGQTDA